MEAHWDVWQLLKFAMPPKMMMGSVASTHQAGRISLSDAMAMKLLLASLEQYLSCAPKAVDSTASPACL
jgi:hypothetical protein